MKHEYYVESMFHGVWVRCVGPVSREYARGYVDAVTDRETGPRADVRIVRGDGCLEEYAPGRPDVSIGQVAGWATPEQYREAAARAIARAEQIEAAEARRLELRASRAR